MVLIMLIAINELINADNVTTHQKIAELCFDEIYSKYLELFYSQKPFLGKKVDMKESFAHAADNPDNLLGDEGENHKRCAKRIIEQIYPLFTKATYDDNEIFEQLGVITHIIEDLSIDLFWMGALSQENGYGDVSSFTYLTWKHYYNVLKPFNNLEHYLDRWSAAGCGNFIYENDSPENLPINFDAISRLSEYSNASEKELFENIYKNDELSDVFKKFWRYRDTFKSPVIYSFYEESILVTNSMKALLVGIKNGLTNNGINYNLIPSILIIDSPYNGQSEVDYAGEYTKNSIDKHKSYFTNYKTPWRGQSTNARVECLKKSLVSQLFPVKLEESYLVFDKNCENADEEYIFLPEINIYKIDYLFFSGCDAGFYLGGNYCHKFINYSDEFIDKYKIDSLGFNISLYSVIGTANKLSELLNNKAEWLIVDS